MNDKAQDWINFAAAATVPSFVGAGFVYVGAAMFDSYGWALFVVAPVVMGFVASVIYAPAGGKRLWKCFAVGLFYILFISLLVVAWAIEGLVCVGMALPIILPLTLLGTVIGYLVTNHFKKTAVGFTASAVFVLTLPFVLGFETSNKSAPTIHRVVSTVEIDAPIERVWKNVIEFPMIDKRPEGILGLGFAYPINAEIIGTGVGAVRHCNFDTGPFVEPITAWEAPYLLAFDVKEQPAPMTELSPYKDLHAAHLDYIRSQKGQFRLYEQDGKTIVEGTTEYVHDIAPDVYWRLFSDEIIHQIHLRVLNHIKEVSERR